MPWFRLDESFHSHPKVIDAGNEAIGLYVRCGTYAAEHLTNGFIPERVALLYGTRKLAETLVRTKLWRRTRGGWQMPDYLDYNPSREQVLKERAAAAERQRRHRMRPERDLQNDDQQPVDNSRETVNPSSDDALSRRDSRRDSRVSHTTPSRPGFDPVVDVVSRTNGSSGARASPELIDSIINELLDLTGRLIDADWAQRVADTILQGRTPANPVAYIRQAIRNDPDPKRRFLPLY